MKGIVLKNSVQIVIFFMIIFLTFYFYFSPFSSNKNKDDTLVTHFFESKDEKNHTNQWQKTSIESYYTLDKLQIYGFYENNKMPYIETQITLGYPFRDFNIGNDIINKRHDIMKIIQQLLSEKRYSQMNKSSKREIIKSQLLIRINTILKQPISNLYYTNFWIMQVEKF